MEKTLVMLVHGTWGGRLNVGLINRILRKKSNRSLWFEEGSAFFNNLPNRGLCDVIHHDWGGPNSFDARRVASVEVAKKIENAFQKNKYKKLVIIGHSHGGNVALKSLDHIKSGFRPDSENTLVITMATPFIIFKSQRLRKVVPLFWYSLLLMLIIFKFNLDALHHTGFLNIDKNAGRIILFFLFPVLYFSFNCIFSSNGGRYSPKECNFSAFLARKIPAHVIRTSHDEAGFLTNLNSSFFLAFNKIMNFSLNIFAFVMNLLKVPKRNIWLQTFCFALWILGIQLLIGLALYELNTKQSTIIQIICSWGGEFVTLLLTLWALYIVSFSGLGMPLVGLKDTDVTIESVPDANFNVMVRTITQKNIVLSDDMRHSIYNNGECLKIINNILSIYII
ncbi:hypothetical protein AD951_00840 [Acetobacter malorum]|uniref:Fungal lipase-type domain-containing protein n=1 Tax=Acetobacter malorum TaxID=178901 RepID=A0A149V1B4_9PROT|nr:hypothetical protein [Acetobacter malorum]KXV73683.1 hypothetical protein AD951_00840 [Acetobacter malorum]